MSNTYCDTLGIPVPSLEEVKEHREAKPYSLLIVALLEHGGPMTLEEVATRFEEAGVAPAGEALGSLKRCRPARSPVYRDGDFYDLDPHDQELGLWAFRLGLKPAMVPRLSVVRPAPPPLAGPEVPLSGEELAEVFKNEYLGSNWSAQRLAITILDVHGSPMAAGAVVEELNRLTTEHILRESSAEHWGRTSPVRQREGVWHLDLLHPAVTSARKAVRDRIEALRRMQKSRQDPAVTAANIKNDKRRREANAAKLAQLHRVLLHVFPDKAPEVAVLVDVNNHELETFQREDFSNLRARLEDVDVIGAVNVRAVLRALDFDPGPRRLAELGPPQKTRQLNRAGRTLKITLKLLVQGSCGISRPFAEAKQLRGYLKKGETTKLRRRLEADAKSLFALHQYGRLHGAVRLRWGYLDEMLPAPWLHRDEPTLYNLIRDAHEQEHDIELVAGSAPGWSDPWSRARRCLVEKVSDYDFVLVDETGWKVDEQEVQLARLAPR